MKICFATYAGVPFTQGGPYVKIFQLKKSLEDKNIQVDLFSYWGTPQKTKEYDLFHLFGANLGIYNLANQFKNRNLKYVVNPIIFSTHSNIHIRMISCIGNIFKKIAPGFWFDYNIFADICNWSEMVLPNTQAEGNLCSKGLKIPSEKITVIPNGVSEKFLNSDKNLFIKKYGLEDFILFVGHIGYERKNVLNLVKACKNINHKVVIIGKKIDNEYSRKIMAEINSNKNILFIDGLEHNSDLLASAYAACKVFVLPSIFETPGRAALEAGLAGANIVITPYGGTKEYFKEFAEYVEPHSTKSIQSAIEKSLNKPKTERLQSHIKENYLWDKIAEQTISLYEKVIK
ncbi:MAG: glycosyltransferase [Ignavibacteriales bacterium]|nr:glycosyltransferase [Ignavibacteriales bacterium]